MSDDMKAAMASALKKVTKSWKEAKRKADRADRVSRSSLERMRYRPAHVTVREVAFSIMEEAYNKASSNGKYYANARQIMYAARPTILKHCTKSQFDSKYFTQTLLKDYLETYRPNWKVVWDARGHLVEPHTGIRVDLGGIGVRRYLDGWTVNAKTELPTFQERIETKGPEHRFSSVMFIEKEGFQEILTHAGIGTRYDMAIMSTKGIPVDAACDLIGRLDDSGVRVFVLHDFDLAGFKIAKTLREGTRLSVGTEVVELGLRMEDIEDLPSEPVDYKQTPDPKSYLRECGATDEEAEFLAGHGGPGWWHGERVEINAMTSEELIDWLEGKFEEHGVEKVVPDDEMLKTAFKRASFLQTIRKQVEELAKELANKEVEIPEDLLGKVEEMLEEDPELSWDKAVWEIAAGEEHEAEAEDE